MINDIKPPKGVGAEAILSVTPQTQQKAENAKFVAAQSVVKNEETFFSPVVKIDTKTQAAILVYRDTETGEVQREFGQSKSATPAEAKEAVVEKPAPEALAEKPAPEVPAEKPVEGGFKTEA